MEADAKAYNEVSGPQIEAGCQFIRELNLSPGDKVLDMGCGTGHVTKYIADIVGHEGQVVGIDPDVERIKIAKENYKAVGNLQFHVGSSAIGFPHDNEPYYDVHISTEAFHWVPDNEKSIYIRKAHQCLKPGSKLALRCAAKKSSNEKPTGFHSLTQKGYRDLFQEIGLFSNVVVDKQMDPFRFKSFAEFKQWFKASTHQEPDDCSEFLKKIVTSEDDGQVAYNIPHVHITACKN